MKKTIFVTILFSLLCLGLPGCSSRTPKGTPAKEETAAPSAPTAEPQPTPEVQPEQKEADRDAIELKNKMLVEAVLEEEQEIAKDETSPKLSESDDINWPFMKDDFITTTKIPDAAKYAYAIYRALGCPFDEKPMETYSNGDIFDVHNMESCESDDREDELLKRLIQNKADINAYNANGKTLLSLSLFKAGGDYELQSEPEVFDLLLNSGADITKPDADGSTILMKTEFIKTAEKYIAAGGDIHAKNKDGKTALDLQIEKLDKMENGEEIDGDHVDYFYEEGAMGCQNEEAIEKAEEMGEKPPACITYADIIKDNVRNIIKLIKAKEKA